MVYSVYKGRMDSPWLDRSITVTVEGGRWRGTGATLLGLEEEEVQEEEEEEECWGWRCRLACSSGWITPRCATLAPAAAGGLEPATRACPGMRAGPGTGAGPGMPSRPCLPAPGGSPGIAGMLVCSGRTCRKPCPSMAYRADPWLGSKIPGILSPVSPVSPVCSSTMVNPGLGMLPNYQTTKLPQPCLVTPHFLIQAHKKES